MVQPVPSIPLPPRLLACAGALLVACAVALSAYAAHAVDGLVQSRLQTASAFAFGHGIALAALAPLARHGLARWALAAVLAGTLLFAGSLAASHFLGTTTRLAPAGGMLLIVAWLAYALDALRR